jgi:MarR family transcriptional regulator, organic hydroperoxide resistance regulator
MPKKRAVAERTPGSAKKRDVPKVDVSTGYLVRKTFRAFTHSLELRLAPHNVSLSMWFFLRLLWEQDGVTQKTLADELGLTQATTVAAMDVMGTRGLIQRRPNSVDRRKSNIFLTREGHALKTKLLHYAVEVNNAAYEEVSAEEVVRLQELLNRLIRSLDKDSARFKAEAGKAKVAATRRGGRSK